MVRKQVLVEMAEHILDQIEQHIPGFRQPMRPPIVGTPITIERYLLKNRWAVGEPKNRIGQEMLKRLHARSEWIAPVIKRRVGNLPQQLFAANETKS